MATAPDQGCKDCGGPLGRANRTGFCRKCCGRAHYRTPGFAERQRQGVKRHLQESPEKLQALRERQRRLVEINSAPDKVQARRDRMRQGEYWRLANADMPAGSDARMKAGARGSATKMAHIPAHLRETYRHLTNVKKLKAAEALEIVMAQHEAEMERFRRKAEEWAPR